MKTRTGFVSNSSSSSFIICEVVEDSAEVREHNFNMFAKDYDKEYAESRVDGYKGKKIISIASVDNGSDPDDVESMLKDIVSYFAPEAKIWSKWEY